MTILNSCGSLQIYCIFGSLEDIFQMADLYLSKLASWPKTLCLLFLVPRLNCSPINVVESNSLISLIDPTSLLNTTAISRFSPSSLGAPVATCATLPNYPEWFQPSEKFDNGDCPKAIELFFIDYTRDHEGIKYEYLASGVLPVHGIPTQRVPLKVGYGASKPKLLAYTYVGRSTKSRARHLLCRHRDAQHVCRRRTARRDAI